MVTSCWMSMIGFQMTPEASNTAPSVAESTVLGSCIVTDLFGAVAVRVQNM